MNPWFWRGVIIIAAIAIAPAVVAGTAQVVTAVVGSITELIGTFFAAVFGLLGAGTAGIVQVGIYAIVIAVLWRVLFRRR